MQDYRQNPSPDSAIAAHQQLISFHQYTEAAEFRGTMMEQFAENAKVQAYLGEILTTLGQTAEALVYFQKALKLRPDLPSAKIGVARGAIRQGDLDSARPLLAFLEQPGAAQLYSLEPIETLGRAYQKAGRHSEALEIFALLLAELPKVAEHAGFRKTVKASEKALNKKESILPKRPFKFRDLFGSQPRVPGSGTPVMTKRNLLIGAAVAAAFAVIMVGANEYTRFHRKVYIVNAFKKPASVSIDGRESVTVQGTPTFIELPEGRWHARISGPVTQEVDFEIRADFFDRWSSSPAWILNVGGAALIMQQAVTYKHDNPPPSRVTFHYGQPFVRIASVDHPFEPLPKTVSMKSYEVKVLTGLEVFRGDPAQAIGYIADSKQAIEALNLAEWQLTQHPDDVSTLGQYAEIASNNSQVKRIQKFLQSGIERLPVLIEWHRMYQQFIQNNESATHDLTAYYDGVLQKDPGNSAILYLKGRIVEDHAEARQFFEKAVQFDAKNAFALNALGYDYMALGEWGKAQPFFARANESGGGNSFFAQKAMELGFAMEEYATVETNAQARLKIEPLEIFSMDSLILAQAAQHRFDAAKTTLNLVDKRLAPLGAESVRKMLRRHFLYAMGSAAELEKDAAKDRTPDGRAALCLALVEQGKLAEAEAVSPLSAAPKEVSQLAPLSRGLAWLLAGDKNQAAPWVDAGAEILQKDANKDVRQLGTFIKSTAAPSKDDLIRLIVPSDAKAVTAAYLALKFPEKAKDFTQIARQFNYLWTPPHNLIARVIAKTGQSQ